MLTEYISAAMRRAKYEILEDDGTWYAEIPECPGVWANSESKQDCRRELQEVLEGWILLGLQHGDQIPEIDGINLNAESVKS